MGVISPAGLRGSYAAGQAFFNPKSARAVTAPVVVMDPHESCLQRLCNKCAENVFTNTPSSVHGRVAFVYETDITCFRSVLDVARILVSK